MNTNPLLPQSSNYVHVHTFKFRREWNIIIIICLYLNVKLYVIFHPYIINITMALLGECTFLIRECATCYNLVCNHLITNIGTFSFQSKPTHRVMIILKFDVMVLSIYDCNSINVHGASKIQTIKYNLISEIKILY